MHPSTEAILRYFEYAHLPEHLQAVASPFCMLARDMAGQLEGPELTAGLRKLLEAKDCMVRAALDLGKAVPSSAGGGPRDFSAEVGSHFAGRPKAGGQ
jgi:hypothetical protein